MTPKRPNLREFLQGTPPGNQLIAYLTIGDPAERFVELADEVLAAGALTLELGIPFSEPKEGAVLFESHQRALAAGVDPPKALALLRTIAERHPTIPLIAVVQWPAIEAEKDQTLLLDRLAHAGAAAVLAVGMSLWQLPALAARVHERGMQTVVPCPPDASAKFRDIAWRFCSGCIYVPRGSVTGGSQEFGNVGEFCARVAAETDLPIVVGVGVKTAQDVSEICHTPAKAAAVGSALVDHIAAGGSATELIGQLLAG